MWKEAFKKRQQTLLNRLKHEPVLDLDAVQSDRERKLAGRLSLYTCPCVLVCDSLDAVKFQLKHRAAVARAFTDAVPRPSSDHMTHARVRHTVQIERAVLWECRAWLRALTANGHENRRTE